jgi:RNA polymerase sigma factor (sigma-70 family)
VVDTTEKKPETMLADVPVDSFNFSTIHQGKENSQIWRQFKSGDRQAFAFIYSQYAGRLTQYGMQLVGDKEFTRDAVQDLFIQLWEQRERLGEVHHSIQSYLFSCLRRDLLKRIKRSPLSLDEIDTMEADAMMDNATESQLFLGENTEEIHRKLLLEVKQLPDRQREAVFLFYYGELDFAQVAQVMSITTRAVYKLIYKAINQLQKKITVLSVLIFSIFLSSICLR